jgi:hypothetical protein
MSRKKRKPNRMERQKKQEKQAKEELEAVVSDMGATLTCSTEISGDLAWQCGHWRDEVEDDLRFNRLAYEFWREAVPGAPALLHAIADLVTEQERHREALSLLEVRFLALEEQDDHEHLEPIQTYQERIRSILAQSSLSQET